MVFFHIQKQKQIDSPLAVGLSYRYSPDKGTSINDVPHFLVIFDLPTYLVLLYNVPFLGLFWTPLPTLIRDVINGRSLTLILGN